MAQVFDRETRTGRTVGAIVLEPLNRQAIQPLVVDVGARNGMVELPTGYARSARYIGFEPNETEYRKLVEDATDAKQAGIVRSRFRSEVYHPTALWSEAGMRWLSITAGAGATTLMGGGRPVFTSNMFLDNRPRVSLGASVLTEVASAEVVCETLDQVIASEGAIDYLKIDVEGAELEVLKGGEHCFRNLGVLLLKTEFQFVPYYEQHPLLGHQQVWLDERGMRLIDLDLAHARYSRYATPIPADCDRRPIFAGDAFFIVDPDRQALQPQQRQRLAAIALALGFNSLGVSLLREAAFLAESEIAAVEAATAHMHWRPRAKKMWNNLPVEAGRLLDRLKSVRKT